MLLKVSSEIHLLPDWTLFVQLGIFLVASLVMYILMVRPIIRILNTRKMYTIEAETSAQRIQLEAEALTRERKETVEGALDKAHIERKELVDEARRRAGELKSNAKRDARLLVDDTEISIDSSERTVFDEMNFQVEHLASKIIEKVSG